MGPTVNRGSLMSIRTLLFDLGNVLLYFSHEQMTAQIAHVFDVPQLRVHDVLFGDGKHLQRRFERGELAETEFHRTLEADFGRSVSIDDLRRAGADIFRPNEPLASLLNAWKELGYRLVLLSNTCVTHYEWVRRRFDMLDRFDDCVLSFEVGAVKPEEAIFRTALARIDCPPAECFYTDDIALYVEQGRAHGLQAETFTDVPTLVRQLEQRGVPCPRLGS